MRIKIILIVLLLFAGLVSAIHALTVVEEAKLIASDGAAIDRFGHSVAISGNIAVVGASEDDDLGDNSGAAYIFQRTGTGWTEVAKLTASDGAAGNRFGFRVAISGDTAFISGGGPAYIFQRIGTNWTEVARLTASDGTAVCCPAISGDTLVTEGVGAVYVFQRIGTDWTDVARLTASDGEEFHRFGNSVAISGNTIVVGALHHDDLGDDSGAAYVYKRTKAGWNEVTKLTASDGAVGDLFGVSVGISGGTIVIGAYHDDDLGSESGSTYIFQRRGRNWTEVAKLTASDGEAVDLFGIKVAISQDTAIVGAIFDDDLGSESGAAYIFQHTRRGWTEVAKLTASDGGYTHNFGWSVDISRDTVVVGSVFGDGIVADSGAAYIFKLR